MNEITNYEKLVVITARIISRLPDIAVLYFFKKKDEYKKQKIKDTVTTFFEILKGLQKENYELFKIDVFSWGNLKHDYEFEFNEDIEFWIELCLVKSLLDGNMGTFLSFLYIFCDTQYNTQETLKKCYEYIGEKQVEKILAKALYQFMTKSFNKKERKKILNKIIKINLQE